MIRSKLLWERHSGISPVLILTLGTCVVQKRASPGVL